MASSSRLNVPAAHADQFGPHCKSSISVSEIKNISSVCELDFADFFVPSADDSPENPPDGYACGYAAFFLKCRLTFPIPAAILDIIGELGLALPQLMPSAMRNLVALWVRSKETGVALGIEDFRKLFNVKANSNLRGTYYFPAKVNRSIFKFNVRDDKWWEQWFYFRISRRSIEGESIIRRSWAQISG